MRPRTRNSRIAALLLVASVNFFAMISSGRLQEIRTVDAVRLILTGLLIGLAIGQLRLSRAMTSER
jgi:hypothetical protein